MEDINNFFFTINSIEYKMDDGGLSIDDVDYGTYDDCPEMFELIRAYWRKITTVKE